MPKFTPGPWIIKEKTALLPSLHKEKQLVVCDGDGAKIAVCPTGFFIGDETVCANARLLVKTPDMYELLKDLYRRMHGDQNIMITKMAGQIKELLVEIHGEMK